MGRIQAEALDRVLLLSSLIAADMARFERESGLTAARVKLLWVLGKSGPCAQHSLARALDVTPRNVTGLVDGLVETGHVTREPHPEDRRALLVTPTPAGERVIAELREGHEQLASRLFGAVPEKRLASFVSTLDDTITTLTGLMAGTS